MLARKLEGDAQPRTPAASIERAPAPGRSRRQKSGYAMTTEVR